MTRTSFHVSMMPIRLILAAAWLFGLSCSVGPVEAVELRWRLTFQQETSEGSGRYHRLTRDEAWKAEETAIIVCDMWDSHHCHRAVLRVNELAPRLDQVLQAARAQGVMIIHAPSSCMKPYADHPARQRAESVPRASVFPPQIAEWCYSIPAEEKGVYPVDQSNGGEDDDPDEHARWAAELASQGRDPGAPWQRQTDRITIDGNADYISDDGQQVWSILESRGIKNVILTGVHTNMCVLGRPFGLRQMVRAGKNTVLMRDMTDTMYEPSSRPFVGHFTGTDLIVDHIERHVCPTITSNQLLGGEPFRFTADQRPTVAILMADDEYRTEATLPPWSIAHLGHAFRIRWIFGSDTQRNVLPGVEAVRDADLLLVSARRRTLPAHQMDILRAHVVAGKPVLGIRTASHAFSLRDGEPEPGTVAWPEFDAEVLGGNYAGHHGNEFLPTIKVAADATLHPIIDGFGTQPDSSGGSLYRTAPLAPGAKVLLFGAIANQPAEPVAWWFTRRDGGHSFYTSLGHPADFENPRFQRFLAQAAMTLVAESQRDAH